MWASPDIGLTNFCGQTDLCVVNRHSNSIVEHTYHLGTLRFYVIDHFVVVKHVL